MLSVRSSSQSTLDAGGADVAVGSRESVVSRLLTHCNNAPVCCRFITSAVSICRVGFSHWFSVCWVGFTHWFSVCWV